MMKIYGKQGFVVLTVLLIILMIGASTAAAEYSGTWGILDWTLDDNGLLTVSGKGKMEDYNFIGEGWTTYQEEIRKAVISEGITSIGANMFASCENLTDVTLPGSLKEIGFAAFCFCSSLRRIRLPEGLKRIGDDAFRECSSLESVMIPDGVTEIGSMSFEDCPATLFASIGSDGAKALAWPGYPFRVPDGMCELKYNSDGGLEFRSCRSDITECTIPDGVTVIAVSAFRNCEKLQHVTIPDSVTEIRSYAFENCRLLSEITLPHNLKSYDADAFCGCENLKSITLPDGITEFVRSWEANGPVLYTGIHSETARTMGRESTPFRIPGGDCDLQYIYSEEGEETDLAVLCHDEGITDLRIPDSVTSIWYDAFQDCETLKSVSLPGSITSIRNNAFEGCVNLEEVTFRGNTAGCTIEYRAFCDCEKLKNIRLPQGVTSIGEEAFGWCYNLQEAILPESLTTIGLSAFHGCVHMPDLSIPDSVGEISDDAIILKTVLHVGADSYARRFAERNGYTYVIRGEEENRQPTATTVEEKVQEIIAAEITDDMSEYRKAVVLHNWLVRNVQYAYTDTNSHYYAEGALLEGKAVCNGFTEAYIKLLEAVGIESYQAYGYDHTWNVVKLEGKWCHVDVTWDEPGYGSTDHFGLTDYALEGYGNHENYDPQHTCDDYRMSMAYRSGKLDRLVQEWAKELAEHIRQGDRDYQLVVSYDLTPKLAIQMLQDTGMTVDGVRYPIRIRTQVTDGTRVILLSLKTGAAGEGETGDVNSDGLTDGRDVVRLMRYLAGEIDPETGETVEIDENNADLNKDGTVDELDLLRLVRQLAGEDLDAA